MEDKCLYTILLQSIQHYFSLDYNNELIDQLIDDESFLSHSAAGVT